MTQTTFLTDNTKNAICTVAIAFLIGVALIASDTSRILATLFVAALPVFYYFVQKTYLFILKCMLIVVFFIPFQFYNFLNLYNVANPLIMLGLVLAVKSFLSVSMKKEVGDFRITSIDKIYFLFLISVSISTLSAISVLGSLNWIFYSVVIGYFVYRAILCLQPQEVQSLMKFVVAISLLAALYGMGEYAARYSLIYGTSIQDRLTSLLGHPLVNGLIFASILPISLILFYETREKRYIASSLILLLAVLLTFSRGSWLSLLIGMTVMFLLMRLKFRIIILYSLLAMSLVIGLIPDLRQAILNRFYQRESAYDSSFNIRLQGIPVAFSIIKDKPFFGGGPFNASRIKEVYTGDVNLKGTSFENGYLGLWVDLGFVGMGILVLLFMDIGKNVLLSLRKANRLRTYKIAALTSILIVLFNTATFNFDNFRLFHFIVWFYVGLNMALVHHDLDRLYGR